MHNYLPNLFIFLDEYNSQIFKNKNINLGIIYRNYKAVQREKELLKILQAGGMTKDQFNTIVTVIAYYLKK